MEDMYFTLTEALAAWVSHITGTKVSAKDFRLPRDQGQLSLGTFVRGDAAEAARQLTDALGDCPSVQTVQEQKGWLLFWLSDQWFDGLIAWAKTLDTRPTGSYVENRMGILSRKGEGPCPEEEAVRRALWAAYLAYRRGFRRAADERLVLTMTHGRTGADRITLENRCGGAAAAILKLRGNFTNKPVKTTEKE